MFQASTPQDQDHNQDQDRDPQQLPLSIFNSPLLITPTPTRPITQISQPSIAVTITPPRSVPIPIPETCEDRPTASYLPVPSLGQHRSLKSLLGRQRKGSLAFLAPPSAYPSNNGLGVGGLELGLGVSDDRQSPDRTVVGTMYKVRDVDREEGLGIDLSRDVAEQQRRSRSISISTEVQEKRAGLGGPSPVSGGQDSKIKGDGECQPISPASPSGKEDVWKDGMRNGFLSFSAGV